MKKLITLTTALFLSLASYAVSVNGTEFKFPNGNLDWSAPVEMTLGSDWMTKKGQPHVKISVRIKAIRKILKGCRYEVEITNIDQNGIRFELDNGNVKGSMKLKPGDKEVATMDSFSNEKRENVEACAGCMMNIVFHEVEGYKK
ncbi:MAG TPA: hypothetical protein VEB40_13005 [Flavipsychrobacter sp.]|nr:hypothetical protein [Flavipsychrobacter sp.]